MDVGDSPHGARPGDTGRRLLAEWVGGQALGPGVRARASCLGGRFCDDVAWMTGRRPSLYWRVTWKVVSPLLLLTIFVAYIALLARAPPSYRAWNPQYVGPLGGDPGALGPTLGLAWPFPGAIQGPEDPHSRHSHAK